MPISTAHIASILNHYLDQHPDEKRNLEPLADLLTVQGADPSSRTEFRGHATASVVLINDAGRILHIEHIALGLLLRPGGHLEEGDTTLQAAALRELEEETGIPAHAVTPLSETPLHIDAHTIPANPRKGEPEHTHYDFRFVFRTTSDVRALQEEEVSGSVWLAADEIDEQIRDRLALHL